MRSDAPVLLPILRSRHQADLLTMLLLHPGEEYAVTDLARQLNIPQSTVSGEVRRLSDAGILTVRAVGRSRLVRTDTRSPLVPPLTELVTLTYGPHTVIADEFGAMAGILQVIIFGSWAARYSGEHGQVPQDLDVLVVGTPDRLEMYESARRAEERLRRAVNPTVCTATEWEHPSGALVREIQARPYLTVVDHATSRLEQM
ncbi:winged helix-turn-helix domain-containing protein [Tenggerimyces flavus]|uniref:Winged helix-turn-helix domain-containing protein n=1 Tax=Tenggerimyces flavus TaxID=1708749 RepID=A0ABV7Y8A9_9ACTN|nr:winged helix-turn-helix domain-containing protein [Tenggerimyces flavus]MBM7785506.1 DNA-binding transcriptional ArsR family regulator [Tenggerimyces flavus]